jgi:acyl-CoA synthetase (AMP-forming)/AMP-acid ligase II
MNVVEPIFLQSENKPSELALCVPGTDFNNILSYARLRRSVNSICRRFISTGIAPRDRFAVLIDDPILHVLVLIALTRLGIVTISGQGQRLTWPIKLDGVIADKPYEFPQHRTILADPAWTTDNDQAIEEKHLCRAAPNDICRLFLTSAMNGHENVIAMTNRMIATRLDRQKLFLGARAPFCDRTCLDLPLATPLGFQLLLATLWRGGALIMTRDLRKTIAALTVYNIKNLVSSPRGLLNFTETIENLPGTYCALEAVFCAGTTESQLTSERARARLCPNLTIGYVAPDATMVASMPAHFASRGSGAAGYVVPGVVAEIVDQQGCAVPPGNEGDLRIRSDYGVTEYLENPPETQRAFRDGWFYPGNRGHLTRDNMLILTAAAGRVRVVGNETDVRKIEDILSEHTNVLHCGVAAVKNESAADELCAFVVPRSYLDVEALRSYCKTRLPSDLVPSRFVAFAELPKDDNGRIDRAKLLALLKNNLN